MGDEQSKISQQFLDQHADIGSHSNQKERSPKQGNKMSVSNRMDSEGESDTSQMSGWSRHTDIEPQLNGSRSSHKSIQIDTRKSRIKSTTSSSQIGSQTDQMRHISSSVPNISKLGNGKNTPHKRLGMKKYSSLKETIPGHITFKKKIDECHNSLMGSQLVFVSSAEDSQDELLNGRQSRSSSGSSSVGKSRCPLDGINMDNCVQQCDEMKRALTQLQSGNQQILQRIDDNERGNKEWISMMNKKTSGIQKRLLRIGEKVCEDETALQQLTNLVTTIHQKFEELNNLMKTKCIRVDHSSSSNTSTSPSKSEIVDVDNVKNENVPEEVPNIDLSSLPSVSKDRKGYKQRCTERHNDNRRQMRKEKRSCKYEQDRCNTDNLSSVQNNTEADNIEKHGNSSSRLSEDKQVTVRKPRSTVKANSFLDSRDDYRNLPVLASGDRVYASMPQEIIHDCQKFWLDLAAKEKDAARRSTLPRQDGVENFLVLDTSASMDGGAFTEMIQTAQNYINGLLENSVAVTRESLCIVEVGQRTMTRVLVHMTNDISLLLSALDELKPGGMSPMAAGLIVVKDLVQRDNTNIVVISDGKMTPIHIRSGNDSPELFDEQIKYQMKVLGLGFQQLKCRLFFIPVGPYDSSQIEDLVKMTGGEEVLPRKISRVYNYTMNVIIAVRLVDDIRKQNPGAFVVDDQIRQIVEDISHNRAITPEEVSDICRVAKVHADTSCNFVECDPNMPPLGTRVRRGPDWKWGNQDCDMPGTVVSHTKDGYIWVEWDHGLAFRYRYGRETSYDVVTSEDPRIPDAELISVGCVVTRGKGWNPSNTEDGGPGKTGAVYKVDDDGTLMVRWSNGKCGSYRFCAGSSGEIKLCDPCHQRELLEATGGLPSYNDEIDPASDGLPSNDDEIDKKVAEMNRKNALISKIPSKIEDKSPEKRPREKTSETTDIIESPGEGVWQRKDGYGGWKSYCSEHNSKLETVYCKHPKGTTVLSEGKSSYRILFPKLKQVNMKTKEMIDIRRVLSPS